jgi:pyruvate/2-oxoglutarate dehydrogenase complex dihydrolipoamide dehydrogenase (E3) component
VGRVVCLGAGATGEAFVAAMRRADPEAEIILVERNLVGGECTYFACMPSKTLLRSPELEAAAGRAPGANAGAIDADAVFGWRDAVVDGLDDAGHLPWLEERGVELVRGEARITGPGRLEVDGDELAWDTLVVATGSDPLLLPELEGVEGVWTNREATTASEVPESLAVLGGGAVGCELSQFYRRAGARVTLIDVNPRIIPREHEDASALLQDALTEEGVEIVLNAKLARAEAGFRLGFADGRTVEAERVLVAIGRKPNVDGLGLEQLGIRVERKGIVVDERLRAAENVYAIGDVTGQALFTHVGKYQARVAAEVIGGSDVRADYRAIPRVLFTDPQVASVGSYEGVSASWEVNRVPRSSTYERPKRKGFARVFADPERKVLVGAVAVGPEAGEWLGQLTLAIRAEVPVDVLRDTIQPFPTFSEAFHFAVRELPL